MNSTEFEGAISKAMSKRKEGKVKKNKHGNENRFKNYNIFKNSKNVSGKKNPLHLN